MSYRKFNVDVGLGRLDFNDDHYYVLESTSCAPGMVALIFDTQTESVFVAYDVTQHVYSSIDWAWKTNHWGLESAYDIYKESINFVPREEFSGDVRDLIVETIGDGVDSGNLDPDEDVESLWSKAIDFMKDNPELFEEEIYKKFESQLA